VLILLVSTMSLLPDEESERREDVRKEGRESLHAALSTLGIWLAILLIGYAFGFEELGRGACVLIACPPLFIWFVARWLCGKPPSL